MNPEAEKTLVKDLPIDRKLCNILIKNGCTTLGDVVARTSYEIVKLPGVGPVRFRQLVEYLWMFGLCLKGETAPRRLSQLCPSSVPSCSSEE